MLTLNAASPFVSEHELSTQQQKALQALTTLDTKTGKGNDFLGWINLPSSIDEKAIANIQAAAQKLSDGIDIVVVIGIGGSYLGAKAVIDALSHSFASLLPARRHPLVVFAGQNISEDYLCELMEVLKDKSSACVVISKSGTTTEPAIAFRIIKQHLEEKYGKAGAKDRIVAITDEARGALRTLATQEGYTTFSIPNDVGGRFSVLTPVGLLPVAIAGLNITELVKGAADMEAITARKEADMPISAMRYTIEERR